MGMKIVIFIILLDIIGVMFCNFLLGGLVKFYLVREIDVFGGEMGRNIDKIFI